MALEESLALARSLDHTEGGFTCKHYFAATIVHKRDVLPDGTVIETKSVTFTEKKVYKQDWPKYNAAQAGEKRIFDIACSAHQTFVARDA